MSFSTTFFHPHPSCFLSSLTELTWVLLTYGSLFYNVVKRDRKFENANWTYDLRERVDEHREEYAPSSFTVSIVGLCSLSLESVQKESGVRKRLVVSLSSSSENLTHVFVRSQSHPRHALGRVGKL